MSCSICCQSTISSSLIISNSSPYLFKEGIEEVSSIVLWSSLLSRVEIHKAGPQEGGGGVSRGSNEPPFEAQDFFFFAVADLTERRLLDCQDCQD